MADGVGDDVAVLEGVRVEEEVAVLERVADGEAVDVGVTESDVPNDLLPLDVCDKVGVALAESVLVAVCVSVRLLVAVRLAVCEADAVMDDEGVGGYSVTA